MSDIEAPQNPANAPATNVIAVMPPGYRTLKLPSGATAWVMENPLGKHIDLAMRMAGREMANAPARLIFAHLAVRVMINGRPITIEDVEEMSARDINVLQPAAMGNDVF